MNRSFIITEEERKRILNLHETATKKQYLVLKEQAQEPVLPNETTIEGDLNGTFKSVPCVTKKGWLRGADEDGNIFYNPKGSKYIYYEGNGNGITPLYVQTGETLSQSKYVRDYTCKERPFTQPAQTEEELTSGKKTLTLNDNSPMVTTLIQKLKNAQQLPQEKEEGTKFDKVVRDAVIKFQKVNNLKPDGVVGKKTWTRLSELPTETTNNPNVNKRLDTMTKDMLGKTTDFNQGPQISPEQSAKVKSFDTGKVTSNEPTPEQIAKVKSFGGGNKFGSVKPNTDTTINTVGTSKNMKEF